MSGFWGAGPVLEHEAAIGATGNRLRIYDTRFKNAVRQSQLSRIEIQELDAAGNVVGSIFTDGPSASANSPCSSPTIAVAWVMFVR